MGMIRDTAVMAMIAALSACGGVRAIVPDQSTLAEVRDRMGRPTDIRFDAKGHELWEYTTGPAGEVTYLVRARADGRVVEVVQLLTEARFADVMPHVSTKAQV